MTAPVSDANSARAPSASGSGPAPHRHQHGPACGCGETHSAVFDPAALVSARGLKLSLGGRPVLDGVDVDIRPREIVTLIGPNGSGKTTLVRVLLGVEKVTSGEVRRRPGLKVGYVPQRFDIDRAMPMTVARFLTLGRTATRKSLAAVLAEVGAERCLDQQLADLSGGEMQRVLLARALTADPDLLVLDEPVSGVDYTGEAELYALIGRLRDTRGIGVLLVSHDLHVVMASSDRVLCLNRHICCSGVPETVAQHPEYTRLFGPEMARAFGVYRHHHDHSHGLDGSERPASGAGSDGAAP